MKGIFEISYKKLPIQGNSTNNLKLLPTIGFNKYKNLQEDFKNMIKMR